MRACRIPCCTADQTYRGVCQRHYQHWIRGVLPEIFEEYIDLSSTKGGYRRRPGTFVETNVFCSCSEYEPTSPGMLLDQCSRCGRPDRDLVIDRLVERRLIEAP